jgi:hypothetical protein
MAIPLQIIVTCFEEVCGNLRRVEDVKPSIKMLAVAYPGILFRGG